MKTFLPRQRKLAETSRPQKTAVSERVGVATFSPSPSFGSVQLLRSRESGIPSRFPLGAKTEPLKSTEDQSVPMTAISERQARAEAWHVRQPLPGQPKKSGSTVETGAATAQRKEDSVGQAVTTSAAKSNRTGLPDRLKSGIEALSGMSLDHVKVHYNSSQPAKLQALAFTRGNEIHVAPGQERHLPHEAWHVVQQAQGRVKPTLQMKGKPALNQDAGLEQEADLMGQQALAQPQQQSVPGKAALALGAPVIQARKVGKFGLEAEVMAEPFVIAAEKGSDGSNLIDDEQVSLEEYKLGEIGGNVDVTLDNERKGETETHVYRTYTVEFVQKAINVVTQDVSSLVRAEEAWRKAEVFWAANIGSRALLKGVVNPAWYQITPSWKGGQFDGHTDKPGVSKAEGQDGEFDWRHPAFNSYIGAKTADPNVSMQLTAGSSLHGFTEIAALTQGILLGRGMPKKEELESEQRKNKRLDDYRKPETQKLNALLMVLKQYVDAHDADGKRYAKEYVTLMSRTSLDMIYGQLNVAAKGVFKQYVDNYLRGVPDNLLGKLFKRPATDRVFQQDASKEPEASAITIAQMLLSITKQKPGEEADSLVDDAEAGAGDIFSQRGLAGISEIHPEAGEMIAKYGLQAANEMMTGHAGIIFESRAAKVQKLSVMPSIFQSIARTLQQIELLDRAAKQVVHPPPKKPWEFWK